MNRDHKLDAAGLQRLLGDWRQPGVTGVAGHLCERLTRLIRSGRLPVGTRLPAEREFARALGISRTTVAGVYDTLRVESLIESRQGSGSWVLPARGNGGAIDADDGSDVAPPWYPGSATPQQEIDLTQAALPAPSTLLPTLLEQAAQALARHAEGHGYHLLGLPELREAIAHRFCERGLPTHAGQILVTTGAQQALALGLCISLHPGSRVLVDHPTYPNALSAIRQWGGRCVPVELDETGWAIEHWHDAAHQARPDLFYCVPDVHNPSGALMTAASRQRLVDVARLCGAALLIDETLAETVLDSAPLPPTASAAREGSVTMTIGSLSKIFWGGLRVGWMRAPEAIIARAATAKAALDMATPVLDQLMAVGVFERLPALVEQRRQALREARAALTGELAQHIPDWRVQLPAGGLSTWIDLRLPLASRLAEAARGAGVAITPGSLFGVDGSFEDRIRLPYTLDAASLREAVRRLAAVWESVREGRAPGRRSIPAMAV